MGETDCSKSSNIATLTFDLSENPILDLKSRHRKSLFEAKARNRLQLAEEGGSLFHHMIRPLLCRIVARERYANIEQQKTA
jgi:hypothetical protein